MPPLNMLVMGKDHKIYYEAYNDASDLDGDGILDVGYRGWERKAGTVEEGESPYKIDYYGYFNSYACYTWINDRFVPRSATNDKTCGGSSWSGDFLNYLTTSRMDALRRVLYGGWRQTDTAELTVLQGAFFPQDAHSWGKEYQSYDRDGYNIADYAPLSAPKAGKYHLFAVTTTSDNTAPLFRVMQNGDFRVWNWLSIEGPVAGNKCFTEDSERIDCVNGGAFRWSVVPAAVFSGLTVTTWKRTITNNNNPDDQAGMNRLFNDNAVTGNICGSGPATNINKPNDGNPFSGNNGCGNDNYLSRIEGTLNISVAGDYTFAVDGDDAVDVFIDGSRVASWYGGHAAGDRGNPDARYRGTVRLSAGAHTVRFRHQDNGGGDSWALLWYQRSPTAERRTDYSVRVEVCPPGNNGIRDTSCKAYPGGSFKPTGILHDYGESQRMYFGLITGSQFNNLEGGVLRRNISDFASEIDPQTGIFKTTVNGIARSIDRLRMIGGGYGGGTSNNLNSDSNWNWANGYGNCPSFGDRALANGECRMWGNPIAEMLYESMRYFAGAGRPTSRFATGGASEGVSEENAMHLTTESWKDPYKTVAEGGLGYATCAKPYQTVISDINPSYDGDLPGSAWNESATNDVATLSGFNASTEGSAIWAAEFGGTRDVFIGEAGGTVDGAPTVKRASSFGNIRGLAPEEPTKQGTYYSASVARFGRNNDINPAANDQNLMTYSIALASPLPRIEFPVAGRTVTLIPFAKTVSGTFGNSATHKPVNTIVDFYVERVVNLKSVEDANINEGRPYAVFRINYEDVEQGNDHDMDAIARYTIQATADGKVQVDLSSEYAAGSADQNIGYIISGTTKDGVYLEVRDRDGPGTPYVLNTPPGAWAGDCAGGVTNSPCNQPLGINATRTFTPSGDGAVTGIQLKDPLWYAAKYGAPVAGSVDDNGDPTNYFLVTNPLNLREQLTKAFDDIQDKKGPSGSLAISGARVSEGSLVVMPRYSSADDTRDWTGDLEGYPVNADGSLAARAWNAASNMPDTAAEVDERKIFTAIAAVDDDNRAAMVREFKAGDLALDPSNTSNAELFGRLGYTVAGVINDFGAQVTPNQMVNYLRGYRSMEGTALNTAPFRRRSGILGDIINSAPVIATKRANYGWAAASGLPQATRTAYTEYVNSKASNREYVYVGANDGMLHGFDDLGVEKFAYVPNGVLSNMGLLATRDYQHHYYVDGKLTLSDARIGSAWKTVLVGGAGAGGRTVFALNVTDPANFAKGDVLWEVNSSTDADIGYVMGKPVVVPLQNGKWVALFGNGYNSESGKAALFAVDLETGKVLAKIVADDGTANADLGYNGLGNITVLDTDGNGLVDTVYGGDLHGNVWKFNVKADDATDWDVSYKNGLNQNQPLFIARDAQGNRQSITGAFEVAVGPGVGYMLYFGTGRYFVTGDNDNKDANSVYGIWDDGTPISNGRTALVGQTLSSLEDDEDTATDESKIRVVSRNPVSYYTHRGWYMDLTVDGTKTGERFIATPTLREGRIYFTTYIPGVGSDCLPGGENWLYSLTAGTGAPALGEVSIPPGSDPIGGGNAGGVATGDGAPSQGVGSLNPVPQPKPYCDPSDPDCDPESPPTICSEVIVDPSDTSKTISRVRACGRQSWRQLR
ncbi:MAG TPA: fimbrial protein [Xanthomonadaceae bacterium]|nr:fimbrial protein [Xanthomonadaceae bacterium]